MSDSSKTPIILETDNTELQATITAVLNKMATVGYCRGTIQRYRQSYRRLLDFADSHDIKAYSPRVGKAFVKDFTSYIIEHPTRTKTLFAYVRTAIQKLDNFVLHKDWSTTVARKPFLQIPEPFAEGYSAFLEYCKMEHPVASATIGYIRHYIPHFLMFLYKSGLPKWDDLYPGVFSAYFASLRTLGPRSLDSLTTYVRLFMSFLLLKGFISQDWKSFIPRFRPFSGQHLPPVWPSGTVDAILSVIDRSTVQGKRDYAIILLASRLGMRAGDIRTLQLDNLNWEEARIEFIQNKTGKSVTLPMTDEVGNALIDYLRSGRQVTNYRNVFLRVIAPYQPIKNVLIYNQLNRYLKLSGVNLPKGTSRGLHALRHTLASQLQSASVPLETIAGILGHTSLDSTRIYARVDLTQLRTAALDPEEVIYAR